MTAAEAAADSARSVWTPKDEALLTELTERKQRIMAERRYALLVVVQRSNLTADGRDYESVVQELIANASEFREALRPFDSAA